jgi:hypothetical protein
MVLEYGYKYYILLTRRKAAALFTADLICNLNFYDHAELLFRFEPCCEALGAAL